MAKSLRNGRIVVCLCVSICHRCKVKDIIATYGGLRGVLLHPKYGEPFGTSRIRGAKIHRPIAHHMYGDTTSLAIPTRDVRRWGGNDTLPGVADACVRCPTCRLNEIDW